MQERSMAILDKDKFKEYTRFASYCLDLVTITSDEEVRCVQREMAAEWLALADAVRPSKIPASK
jgi:hypothetical protein